MQNLLRSVKTFQDDYSTRDRRCSTTNESPHQRLRVRPRMHPHSQSWGRAPRRAAGAKDRTQTGIAWLHRIVQSEERMHRASMLRESGHIAPDFVVLTQDPGCKAGTFPHSRSISRGEPEVKQPAWREKSDVRSKK